MNRSDVKQVIVCISADDRELFDLKFGANIAILGVQVIEGGEHQRLQRNPFVQDQIERLVHLAHPAARDEAPDLVAPGNPLADGEREQRALRAVALAPRRLSHHPAAGEALVEVSLRRFDRVRIRSACEMIEAIVDRQARGPHVANFPNTTIPKLIQASGSPSAVPLLIS